MNIMQYCRRGRNSFFLVHIVEQLFYNLTISLQNQYLDINLHHGANLRKTLSRLQSPCTLYSTVHETPQNGFLCWNSCTVVEDFSSSSELLHVPRKAIQFFRRGFAQETPLDTGSLGLVALDNIYQVLSHQAVWLNWWGKEGMEREWVLGHWVVLYSPLLWHLFWHSSLPPPKKK